MILLTILAYFALLMLVSRLTSRKADNDTFYRGNRHSPWYMVAFGMIGASISGITFVSVPGMVAKADMTYMQTWLSCCCQFTISTTSPPSIPSLIRDLALGRIRLVQASSCYLR